jgi:hypothetical protein
VKITIIHGQNHKGSTYHIGYMLIDKIEGDKEITEFFLPKDLIIFAGVAISVLKMIVHVPFMMRRK